MEIKSSLFEFMLLYVLLPVLWHYCHVWLDLISVLSSRPKIDNYKILHKQQQCWRCSNHCWLPIGHKCQTQLLIGCWYHLNNMVSMQVITTQDDHLVWISFLCVMLSSGLSRQLLKSNLWAHSRFWEDDELTLISWFGHRATWSWESFLCCHEIKLGVELRT